MWAAFEGTMTQNTQTTAERVRDMAVSQIAAEIDALTAERDKAQAEVERLTREVNRVIDERESVTTIGLAMQERAQVAEAEAERLRPAAEAWEKLVAFRGTDRNWMNHPETVIDAFEDFLEAAREVRE